MNTLLNLCLSVVLAAGLAATGGKTLLRAEADASLANDCDDSPRCAPSPSPPQPQPKPKPCDREWECSKPKPHPKPAPCACPSKGNNTTAVRDAALVKVRVKAAVDGAAPETNATSVLVKVRADVSDAPGVRAKVLADVDDLVEARVFATLT